MKRQKKQVAIQGIAGCFHDAAAREFFAAHYPDYDVATVECDTFPAMFDLLASDAEMMGIVAIENTIAGALLPNHELLRRSNLAIVGEHKMRISHVLAAPAGQTIDDIKEVCSHPMALMQCEAFFAAHPAMKMTEDFDTAGSARRVAGEVVAGRAAVCSEYAAHLYGLQVLAAGIETDKHNFTRFLVLAHPEAAPEPKAVADPDKASIVFTLPHSRGALSKVLTILSFYDMNLTKIQSLPLVGREWEYRFYVDLSFADYHRYRQALDAVMPLITEFKLLGEYN